MNFAVAGSHVAALVCGALVASLAVGTSGSPVGAAGNHAALVELGKAIFTDRRLSATKSTSCATCHSLEAWFADRKSTAIGDAGTRLTRNVPSLMDVRDRRALFWDGRGISLEDQAISPLLSSHEHGLAQWDEVAAVLRSDPVYLLAFKNAFGPAVDMSTEMPVIAALAAFQRSLQTPSAPFDVFLSTGASHVMTESALRGWRLFRAEAQCSTCHTAEGIRPAFTDDAYHMTALGLGHKMLDYPALIAKLAAAKAVRGTAAVHDLVLLDGDVAALGRFVVTFDPRDIGKFRTPSLRNVANTAPYMHDGSVATLEEVIDIELYRPAEALRPPIQLSRAERADLAAFLRALGPPEPGLRP